MGGGVGLGCGGTPEAVMYESWFHRGPGEGSPGGQSVLFLGSQESRD